MKSNTTLRHERSIEMEETQRTYYRGSVEDTEELVDFANMVFCLSDGGLDFSEVLPKAYAKDRQDIPVHHLVKEKGKIKGLVDVYPLSLRMDRDDKEETMILKAGYIGTVSVHPNERKKGHMKKLMEMVEQTAIEQEYDLMILDGNRHRYQHFGFERAGIAYNFFAERSNVGHCCISMYESSYLKAPVYRFEELEADSPYIKEVYEMYMKRAVTARTIEDFFVCLQSYEAYSYSIWKEETLVGYLNLSANGKKIHEFELVDLSELPKVIYDFMQEWELKEIAIVVGVDEVEKSKYLEKMSDYFNAAVSHEIKILNYAKVLEFLFAWKQKYSELAIGTYIVGIRHTATSDTQEYIEKYQIEVFDRQTSDKESASRTVKVERTQQNADVVFESLEFVKALTTIYCLTEQQTGTQARLKDAPSGWFPLPFYLPSGDTF